MDLSKAISEILLKKWDPIGVNDIEEAYDEYDNYVGPIVSMLNAGKNAFEIKTYLLKMETERMGLPGNEICAAEVADQIAKIKIKE